MSRNYGIGSSNMLYALCILISQIYESYSSISTLKTRIRAFVKWIELNHGIRRLEHITKAHVLEYAEFLSFKYSTKSAHNYLSAINVCMEAARGDRGVWVSADKDTTIPRKSNVTDVYKGLSDECHLAIVAQSPPTLQSIFGVCRSLGLRFREASLLDNRAALKELREKKKVVVINGTKGGRRREIFPDDDSFERVIQSLEMALRIQSENNNIIPPEMSYATFKRHCYKEATRLKARFHSERHSYANEEYSKRMSKEMKVNVKTPVTDISFSDFEGSWCDYLAEKSGMMLDQVKHIDEQVRLELSKMLGHNRIEIVSEYIGAR